jgi:hypothetical protein
MTVMKMMTRDDWVIAKVVVVRRTRRKEMVSVQVPEAGTAIWIPCLHLSIPLSPFLDFHHKFG